jgi:hypothetical protein
VAAHSLYNNNSTVSIVRFYVIAFENTRENFDSR